MTLMSDSSASFRSRFSRIVAAAADDDDCCDGVEDDMAKAHSSRASAGIESEDCLDTLHRTKKYFLSSWSSINLKFKLKPRLTSSGASNVHELTRHSMQHQL